MGSETRQRNRPHEGHPIQFLTFVSILYNRIKASRLTVPWSLRKEIPIYCTKPETVSETNAQHKTFSTSFQNPCAVFQSLYTLIPKSQFKKSKTDRESLCTEQRAFPRKARVRISSNFELTWGLTFAT